MSESWADAAMGCEVRLSLLDGTTTTIQATALSMRLGEAIEVEVDLQQFRRRKILLTCPASVRIEPCAANAIAISFSAFPKEKASTREKKDSRGELLRGLPFSDCAMNLLANLSPFCGEIGARVLSPDWAPAVTLLALMRGPTKIGKHALETLRVDIPLLFRRTELFLISQIAGRPPVADAAELERSRTAMLGRLLDTAAEESQKLGHDWIGTEHLLLAAVKMAGPDLQAIFEAQSLSYSAIRARVVEILGKQ